MKAIVEDLLEGDDWEEVSSELVDTDRWHYHRRLIFKHKETEKFFSWYRCDAATEYQENDWTWQDEIELEQVWPVKVETIKYLKGTKIDDPST